MAQSFPSWPRLLAVRLLLLCLSSILAVPGALSQMLGDDPIESLSIESIQELADAAAAAPGLDETSKATLAEVYRNAISNLETEAVHREAIKDYLDAIERGPEKLARLRAAIAARSDEGEAALPVAPGMSLAEIERELRGERAELAVQQSKLAEIKAEIERDRDRPAAIRRQLGEAQDELEQLPSGRLPRAGADQSTDLAMARRWAARARMQRLRAEVLKLEQELASLPIRLDLLRARRDLAELELDETQRRVQALESAANRQRRKEAEQAKSDARAAEREAASEHPLVADLAARNAALGEQIDELAAAIGGISGAESDALAQAKRIEDTFSSTQKKTQVAGVSQALGQLLLEQRRNLPDIDQLEKEAEARANRIAEATLSQIVLEEERSGLRDLSAYVRKLASQIPPAESAEISPALRRLAQSRQALIDRALSVQRTYLRHLGELDFAKSRLADTARRFDAFLDKRLLWVRSSQPAGLDTIRLIPVQLEGLFDAESWDALIQTLFHEFTSSPWIGLALVVALLLWLRRPRLLAALRDTARNVGVIMRDRVGDTLRGFGLILLLALPWSLPIFVIGYELRGSYEADVFTKDVGRALMVLGPLLFQFAALRLLVAPKSIADAHFGWRKEGLRRLYRDLAWFIPLLMVFAGFTTVTLGVGQYAWGSGLGRLLFLVTMLLFAAFFFRLSRPTGGTLTLLSEHNPEGWLFRLRRVWFVLLISSPLAAAAVALAGFMFTAGTIIGHILNTTWLVLLVILTHQLVVRWLVVNQRRLRLNAILAKREAGQEADEPRQSAIAEAGAILAADVEEPKVDFKALDETSRKMVNNILLFVGIVGTWFIWDDMLPALRVLDDVTLWTYSKPGADHPVPITLASLGLAILALGLIFVVTRQLPAFLEIALLQRLNMTQGSRYTVVTLTKYVIVALGLVWIFNVLGGSWSEFQWIFAALGVGIGFGLQEIVANFISGLIILFERPIRVGDVVTVGNTDGVVTRIRIRATTIRNWDRKELLVPNKNFITQELLNWSLSDQTTRLVINVGVAYGSDVEKAIRIMEKIAKDHPRVLDDPVPLVVFEQFGDNALQLSLRCFMDDIDIRLRVATEINLAINRAMGEAGIEIAFPQRDVHLDTRRPLDVRIRPDAAEDST